MKLLLDEMFSAEIAVQLRRRGHDVPAVNERRDLQELPDPDLFQAAQADSRPPGLSSAFSSPKMAPTS